MRSECGAGVRLVLRGGRRRSGAHRSGVQRGAHRGSLCGSQRGSVAEPGVASIAAPGQKPPLRSAAVPAPHTIQPRSPHPGAHRDAVPQAATALHPSLCTPAPRPPSRSPAPHPPCSPTVEAEVEQPPMAAGPVWQLSACWWGGGTRSLPLLGWESAVPPPKWMPPHLGVLCPWPRGSVLDLCPTLGMVLTPPPPAPLRGGAPPAPLRSQPSDAKQELPWQQVGEFQLLLQQQGQEGGNGGGRGPQMGGQQDLSWGPRLLLPPTNPPPE